MKIAVQQWRQRREGKIETDFAARTRLLCWLWAGVVLIFFAVSTNQEYYTFPAYLPLLMLLAEGVARCEQAEDDGGARAGWLRSSAGLLAVIGAAASVVLAAGLWQSRTLPFEPDIGTVLSKQDANSYSLSMDHIFDLTGNSFAALRLPAMLAAVALLLGPSLALWFRMRKRGVAATWTTAYALALFLIAAHIALVRFGPYLGSKVIAANIAPEIRANDRLIFYGDQAYGSSLLFYLKRPVELVNGKTTGMWFGSTFADAPKIWIGDAQLRQAWDSQTRVFLFVPPHERAHVENVIPEHKVVVSEHSGKIVYSNR